MRNLKKTFSAFLAALMLVTAFVGYIPVKAADVLPEVTFVGVEHSPLVVGDKETLFLSSKGYVGQVQYQLFINEEGTDVWTEMTNGFTAAVDANKPFAFNYDKAFKAGQYNVAVRVKRANQKGANTNKYGDYDSAYGFKLNCVEKDDKNRVYTAGNLNLDKAEVVEGDKVTVTGIDNISGIPGPYTYKIHVYDVTNDTWTTNVTDYQAKPVWEAKKPGTYVLDVWETAPSSKAAYEGWKLKVVTVISKETAAQNAAEKAVAAFEKAAKADLTVAANLKAAQDASTAANAAVAKVTDKDAAAKFAARVKTAQAAVDAEVAHQAKLSSTSAAVASLQDAVKDLSTQAKIDAATSAAAVTIDMKGLTEAEQIKFTIAIDQAKTALTYGKKVFTTSSAVTAFEGAVVDLSTQAKLDAATSAAVVDLTGLNKEDAAKLQARLDAANAVLTVGKAVAGFETAVANLTTPSAANVATATSAAVIDLTKVSAADAAKFTTRIADAKAKLDYAKLVLSTSNAIATLEATDLTVAANVENATTSAAAIVLDGLNATDKAALQARLDAVKTAIEAAKGIKLSTVAEALTFGSKLTVTCAYPGAVNYQVFNADGSLVTNPTTLGTATMVYPAKKAGDKVTVKLLNAAGTVLVTKEVTVGTDTTVAKPAPVVFNAAGKVEALTFGAKLTVTSTMTGAVNFQAFNADGSIVTNQGALGTATMIYPAKKAGDKVTVKLYDAAGAELASGEVTLQ